MQDFALFIQTPCRKVRVIRIPSLCAYHVKPPTPLHDLTQDLFYPVLSKEPLALVARLFRQARGNEDFPNQDLHGWKSTGNRLFILGVTSHSRIFVRDDTITDKWILILTYVRPFCEVFLVTHLGHATSVDMVISENPDNHTCCRAFCSRVIITRFKDLGLSRPGFVHPSFCVC